MSIFIKMSYIHLAPSFLRLNRFKFYLITIDWLYLAVNLSPVEFARHAGKINAHTNWKSQIWVFNNDGHKIALWRTCLLKHHTHTFQRLLRQVIHRDEFIRCSQCRKERRFSLRSKEACKIYHDALVSDHWTCSDMPNNS